MEEMGEVEADDWNPEKIKRKQQQSQHGGGAESKGRTRQRLKRKGAFAARIFIGIQFHFSFMVFVDNVCENFMSNRCYMKCLLFSFTVTAL